MSLPVLDRHSKGQTEQRDTVREGKLRVVFYGVPRGGGGEVYLHKGVARGGGGRERGTYIRGRYRGR